jgi:putative FmdB family regulatory protein
MPNYDYLCAGCGPFEAHADASAVGAGASCPSCGVLAARMFGPPGGRAPRRERQLDGLSGAARRRVDRAQAGDGSIGDLPSGARLARGGRPLLARSATGGRRPWQLGH